MLLPNPGLEAHIGFLVNLSSCLKNDSLGEVRLLLLPTKGPVPVALNNHSYNHPVGFPSPPPLSSTRCFPFRFDALDPEELLDVLVGLEPDRDRELA